MLKNESYLSEFAHAQNFAYYASDDEIIIGSDFDAIAYSEWLDDQDNGDF